MHPVLRKYSSLGISEIRRRVGRVARRRVQVEPVVSGTRHLLEATKLGYGHSNSTVDLKHPF